jgi:predicted aspartyl protease
LQLPFAVYRRGVLADGNIAVLPVYLATVKWHQRERDVLVLSASGAALVGMALLEPNRLIIDVSEGGSVIIDDPPEQP